ncbi:MAG: NAD(+)/NADH kinase [Rikenellaceae bacterium]
MKFAIYCSPSVTQVHRLTQMITSLGAEYALEPEHLVGFDMIISYGGDGTFLSTSRRVVDSQLPILGVNGGRLGFLATTNFDVLETALTRIISGDYQVEQRTMISIEGLELPHSDALNEFTLQKRTPSMIYITLIVDSLEVATYWADGIIVSTPTGSTAYSMSVGGAIIAPTCDCWIISPIAPHNLNLRSLVISCDSVVELRTQSRFGDTITATIDNREFEVPSVNRFLLCRRENGLPVVLSPEQSFYETLKQKLYWGLDVRLD